MVLDVIETPSPAGAENRLEAVSGTLLFARFAAPPNSLGYCGGDDHRALVDQLRAGAVGPDLIRLCRAFEGAWPYLRLIATSAGLADPLDHRVVEAYWIGNGLLDRVAPAAFATDLERRFRPRTARKEWPWLVAKPIDGALPHHSFHVLEVMPRIGLLRSGHIAAILPSMEQCLIRPARVVASDEAGLLVQTRPLVVVDGRLGFGPTVEQRVADGEVAARPGDDIAIHWGWSCGRLSAWQRSELDGITAAAMQRANETM
jgi:hypothetical protein